MALTASATERVQKDIMKQLYLVSRFGPMSWSYFKENCFIVKTTFNRPNLFYACSKKGAAAVSTLLNDVISARKKFDSGNIREHFDLPDGQVRSLYTFLPSKRLNPLHPSSKMEA